MPVKRGVPTLEEIRPIQWEGGQLKLLDQTRLPLEYDVVAVNDYRGAVSAIRDMQVRGAPAIGVTASYAVYMAARDIAAGVAGRAEFMARLESAAAEIQQARPTAVNLQWAVERMLGVAADCADLGRMNDVLLAEAHLIREEDESINRRLGQQGMDLIPEGGAALTHCNTGALATAAFGTALGVIRAAWESGKRFEVFNTETRPFLQGARLTSWEFHQLGIPAKLIVDSAAGMLMQQGRIGCVITGADRVAANGDTANKIGTYSLAVLAKENGIPFYVACPVSTIDLSLAGGDDIRIEERPAEEVTHFQGTPTAPEGVEALNPAFDVTPHRYIEAIITENGVCRAPFLESLKLAAS